MPGLFGVRYRDGRVVTPEATARLGETMVHAAALRLEAESGPGWAAGRVHLGVFAPEPQPAREPSGRYTLWLDGEIQNLEDLHVRYGPPDREARSDSDRLLQLHLRCGWKFLREANGLFVIALHDHEERRITLVSDRYGLRPVYWAHTNEVFAYAGEVKTLYRVPGLSGRVDAGSVNEFLAFGYLLGDRTWLEGVEQLATATVLTASDQGIEQERYWSWGEIRTEPFRPGCAREFADRMGLLWTQAVARSADRKRLTVCLSGGLDSRAVVAALPSETSFHTITFGQEGCDDRRFAAQVAVVRGCPNHPIEISAGNWLAPRIDAVYRTDGMLPILDMHGVEALPTIARFSDVDIQAFAGDLILGGSYLSQASLNWPRGAFDEVLRSIYRPSPLVCDTAARERLKTVLAPYQDLAQSDYFYLDNRVRRFTYQGTTTLRATCERRFPSFDPALIEHAYSLGAMGRYEGQAYHQMLLARFAAYFASIPWQKTGLPIGAPRWRHRLQDTQRLALRVAGLAGVRPATRWLKRRSFVDYGAWLKSTAFREFLAGLLLSRAPRSAEHLAQDKTRSLLHGFLDGDQRYLGVISNLMTLEIFLRQLEGGREAVPTPGASRGA